MYFDSSEYYLNNDAGGKIKGYIASLPSIYKYMHCYIKLLAIYLIIRWKIYLVICVKYHMLCGVTYLSAVIELYNYISNLTNVIITGCDNPTIDCSGNNEGLHCHNC